MVPPAIVAAMPIPISLADERVDLGLSPASRRLEHDCSRRFWRSPEGVVARRSRLARLEDVSGEIMEDTALEGDELVQQITEEEEVSFSHLDSLLVVGVLLKLNAFLTRLMLR